MHKSRNLQGSTLALIICIGLVLVLVAVLALNLANLMGVQQEGQRAIDAAALSAAKDMQRVVVQGPLGRVGLVDDTPAFNLASGGYDAHPIIGINTLMATLRLDGVIASQLTSTSASTGNTTILYLVQNDLSIAEQTALLLKHTVIAATTGGIAYDKFGNAITLPQDVTNSYLANPLAGASNPSNPNLTITVGYVNSTTATTSTPTPGNSDSVTKGQAAYQPYTPVPAGQSGSAASLSFQFVPLASQLALISNDQFQTSAPNGADSNMPPTAVQVSALAQSTNLAAGQTTSSTSTSSTSKTPAAPPAENQKQTSVQLGAAGVLSEVSSAECGGPIQTAASGTLVVSFASGGLPGLSTSTSSALPQDHPNIFEQAALAQIIKAPVLPTRSTTKSSTNSSSSGKLEQANSAGGVDFTSVATIMNASLADAQSGTSGDGPWEPQSVSPGFWFTAQGGPVPGTGSGSGSGQIVQQPFKGLSSQTNCNPSVALSFLVYDWLKSLGLRPNVASIVSALTFSNKQPASFYSLESQLLSSGSALPAPFPFPIASSDTPPQTQLAESKPAWIQPSYADSSTPAGGIVSANLNIGGNDSGKDKRNLTNYSKNPQAYQRQQANVWGYVPADAVIPDTAQVVSVANGQVTTADGNNVNALYDSWNALAHMSDVAEATQLNAWRIIQATLRQLNSQDATVAQLTAAKAQMEAQLTTGGNSDQIKANIAGINHQLQGEYSVNMTKTMSKVPRARNALVNARYCLAVADQMSKNMKALTALGASEQSFNHFVLAGNDFWPAYKAAGAAAILGTNPVPTGQASGAPLRDWCGTLNGNASQLVFYKRTQAPAIGIARGGSHLLQPAFASATSSLNPYDNLRFAFYVVGSQPGQGETYLTCGQSPFQVESTLEKQQLYQDVHALKTNQQVTPVTTVTVTPNTTATASSDSSVTTTTGTNTTTVETITCDSGNIGVVQSTWSNMTERHNQNISGEIYLTYTLTTTVVNTLTGWQVQARDQMANGFDSLSAGPIGTCTGADYFSDMNQSTAPSGAGQIAPPNWCAPYAGSSNNPYPQCPALVSEWQLTCPIPITSNMTSGGIYYPPTMIYHVALPPLNPVNSSNPNALAASYNANAETNYTSYTNPFNYAQSGYAQSNGLCIGTAWFYGASGTQGFFSSGGITMSQGAPSDLVQSGNGWTATTSQQCGTLWTTSESEVYPEHS